MTGPVNRPLEQTASLASGAAARVATTAEETERQRRIKEMVDADIKNRRKAPGKAQTLLTSTLVPSSEVNNSLLTSAGMK